MFPNIKSVPADVQHMISDSNELTKIWEKLLVGLQEKGKMPLYGYLKGATAAAEQRRGSSYIR